MYTKKIYFSGGDFHELQAVFEDLPGVVKVLPGYIDAFNVKSQANPEPLEVAKVHGVEVEFNPKKMDLSMLMDVLFSVLNPYAENNLGVYYKFGEDEPQIELHMNFIANRGRQPAATSALLTINDTTLNPKFARKCFAVCGKLKNFSVAEDEHIDFLKKHPEVETDIDLIKFKASLKF